MTEDVIKILDLYHKSEQLGAPMYGIFYKDKMLILSKSRIYMSAGRAKVVLEDALRCEGLFNRNRAEAKEAVEELIKENIIQIRLL